MGTFGICRAQLADTSVQTPVNEPAADQPGHDALHEMPEPWKHWKTHSGKPAECVATVHVDAKFGEPALTVSAVVVRCDGFLLVPRAACERLKVKNATGTVSVIGAEGETITSPIPVAGGRYWRAEGSYPDYGLIKVNDHHIRCLPMLGGGVVQPDLSVDVVYAEDTDKPGICRAKIGTAVVTRVPEGTERTSMHPEHFSLANVQTSETEATEPNGGSAAAIPVGAAIVDRESGAVIGIVTHAGEQPVFATMAQFSRVYSDVAVAPSRSSIAYRFRKDHTLPPGMVLVPGGPLELVGEVGDEYRNTFHTAVACMPDFECDVFPVTNQQYRDWLAGPGGGTPWPSDWPLTELNQPVRRGDLPVLGAPVASAMAFANDRDKRLLTEVEWQRAARIDKLPADLRASNRTDTFLLKYRDLVAEFAKMDQDRDAIALFEMQHGGKSGAEAARQLALSPPPVELMNDFRSITQMAADMAPSGGIFGEVHPVDTITSDVSVYGVRDILTNPLELVNPGGLKTIHSPQKPYDSIDPYSSYISLTVDGETVLHYFIDIPSTAGIYFVDRVVVDSGGTIPDFTAKGLYVIGSAAGVAKSDYTMSLKVIAKQPYQFRCAR